MDVQLIGLIVLALCSLQVVSSADSRTVSFPAKVSSFSGNCPSESQREETRRQISIAALAALSRGLSEDNPASSCSAIAAGNPSGYYWIQSATGPPTVQVYCDFNRQCGCYGPSAWTRVAFLNMSDPTQDCPGDWVPYTSPVRACGRGQQAPRGCSSVSYSMRHSQPSYSRVCGRIIGYQNYNTFGLFNLIQNHQSIDQVYLDGVSLTHGSVGSRQHIWSFAGAIGERETSFLVCDCSNGADWPYDTSFIGNDYFCDSGNEDAVMNQLYYADPLWDGAGCGPASTCCQFNNPPWFCKTLPQPTTDDLEVRICKEGGSNRDTPLQLIELYIQ